MTDQTGRLIRVVAPEPRERPVRIENVPHAVKVLDDECYVAWCQVKAAKYFISLIAKKWPELA